MAAYYNEHDPYAAAWLRNLIAAGLIADGEVDERDILDVRPSDLDGFTQCHFFAGIGGWSHALRLAGWPDDRPVWTGSCPCQPFSQAGSRKGVTDERHLWPTFRWIIEQCQPATVFGEQVASKLGRGWLSGVRTDLEAMGYAVGAADLCAAGVGAPHIRQRLYWMADANRGQRERVADGEGCDDDRTPARRIESHRVIESGRAGCGMVFSDGERRQSGRLAGEAARHGGSALTAGSDCWAEAIWIPCADGKARRIEPGLEPLAHGIHARVGRLRAYGNAIVPQVAAEFVRACM